MSDDSKLLIQEAFVTLAYEQLDALVEFYKTLLGFDPYPYIPKRYAEFALPGLKLALFKPSTNHREEFIGSTASMSVCLEVSDLEKAIDSLIHLGHAPPGPILHADHGLEIYAYDPAGNRLILHQTAG